MNTMLKRVCFLWLILFVAFVLCGCSENFSTETAETKNFPDLSLLEQPNWVPDSYQGSKQNEAKTAMIDLWLSASQNTGGINPNSDSVFPHTGKKYIEGGFHYRFKNETGWYEAVLRAAVEACGTENLRILRCGNERLTHSFLQEQQLLSSNSTDEDKKSIIRDMLTYAIHPRFNIWDGFSGESMKDSFYSLGSVQMNQIPKLDASLLENPDKADRMSTALSEFIKRFSNGTAKELTDTSDSDNPLLYALENIDLSHLSVITVDPADFGRLVKRNENGDELELVKAILSERSVFEKGCAVGLYAFQLDYAGQMVQISKATLIEPLIWGRLKYNTRSKLAEAVLPMPRIMLALVIGQKEKVQSFASSWNQKLNNRSELKTERGPMNQELCYSYQNATVVQEPFSFSYKYELIERIQPERVDNETQTLQIASDEAEVETREGNTAVILSPEPGKSDQVTIRLTLPDSEFLQSTLDWNKLNTISVSIPKVLILSDVVPNQPGVIPEDHQQMIPYRDSLYVFTEDVSLFDNSNSVFKYDGVCYEKGKAVLKIKVKTSNLKPGWYCVKITGSTDDGTIIRQTPSWIHELSVSTTDEEAVQWEKFSQVIHKNEQNGRILPDMLSNAWGGYTEKLYHGVRVPQCPPVWKAFELEELVRQIEEQADSATIPFLDYEFPVLVNGDAL